MRLQLRQPLTGALHRSGRQVIIVIAALGLFTASALTAYSLSSASSQQQASQPSGNVPAASLVSLSASDDPSPASMMICDVQTQASIATSLALPTLPQPHDEWSDHMYVCTYDLDAGPLVITVKELPDVLARDAYFEGLHEHLGQSDAIEGLASFGLPGFKSADGVVIFAKDTMTLEVDASGMSSELGPNRLSQQDFGYQVAANILACWTAHH
jgi:hypothetical protein